MRARGILSILFVLFCFCVHSIAEESVAEPPKSSSVSWSDYKKLYLKSEEKLAIAERELKLAESQLKAQQSLWTTSLELQPYYQKTDYTLQSLEDKESYLQYGLKQTLSWGSELKLTAQSPIWDEDKDGLHTNGQWQLTYDQSLWQNSFGQLDRMKIQQKEKDLKRAQHLYRSTYKTACQQAALYYLQTYREQEWLKIFQQSMDTSQSTLKLISDMYKKRLVKKISYLSAQNDHQQIQLDYLDSKNQTTQSLKQLNVSVSDGLFIASLKDPIGEIQEVVPSTLSWDSVESVLAQKLKLESQALEKDIVQNSQRTLLSAGLLYAEEDKSSQNVAYENNTIGVYLKMNWDLYKPEKKEIYSQAVLGYEIEKRRWQDIKKDVEVNYQEVVDQLTLLKKQRELNKEKLAINQKTLSESYRLMRAGQIEFIDYLRYRDQDLAEQKRQVDLKVKYWMKLLELEKFQDTVNCQGGV